MTLPTRFTETYIHNRKRQCKTCKADRCRRYRLAHKGVAA